MFLVDPLLAAISLLPVPFVVVIASRYGRRARPAQQAVQQRIAELTADAEESIGGVRVVKAFAREDRQLERFAGSTARVFDQEMIATRLSAFYQPLIGFLPQIGLACVLLIGGRRVIAGRHDARRLHRVLHVLVDVAGPDAPAGHDAGARAARDRVGRAAVRDLRPRGGDRRRRPTPSRCRRATGTSSCAT